MQRSENLIRKIFFTLITLAVVLIFNFFLFRILPGDPVKGLIHSPRMSQETQEKIRVQFGLDKPVWVDTERLKQGDLRGAFDSQFTSYINNLLRGNLGVSFASRRDVGEVLAERVWRTVLMVGLGEVLAIGVGIFLGVLAAWRRGSKLDSGILLYGILTWSLPTFFLGIILLILARGKFPIGGMITPGLKPEDGLVYWKDLGRHLVLPTLTLTILYISQFMIIMRSSIVEVLNEDYILTAKAKGLNTFQIMRDHALKNAMLPMITIIALTLGYTVSGAIQIETVFSWPGIGRLMFEAVGKRDYPVLQGTFLILAISVILANFLADIVYSILDPRVKAE